MHNVPALGKMKCFKANKNIKKQTLKLPRDYQHKQELRPIPGLAVMSVDRRTSVKSGLNLDHDFIETSTTIDEKKFSTHHKKQLESDSHVRVKEKEMKSEWGKELKNNKEEIMNAAKKKYVIHFLLNSRIIWIMYGLFNWKKLLMTQSFLHIIRNS